MRRMLSVNIDVNRVRANLSLERGQLATAADVLRLLIRCGCYRWGDRWVAASPLDMLRADEVIDISDATADALELVGSIERGCGNDPHRYTGPMRGTPPGNPVVISN
jgi:hypothetical protein